MNHPLKQYLTQARQSGLSNEQIWSELTQAGWHVHNLIDIVVDAPTQGLGALIISVTDVSKSFGNVKALDQVNLSVKPGQVTALLGTNGAGKTTLVRILATLLTPTSG